MLSFLTKQKLLLEAEARQIENGKTRFAFLMILEVEQLIEQDFLPLNASTFSRCLSGNSAISRMRVTILD